VNSYSELNILEDDGSSCLLQIPCNVDIRALKEFLRANKLQNGTMAEQLRRRERFEQMVGRVQNYRMIILLIGLSFDLAKSLNKFKFPNFSVPVGDCPHRSHAPPEYRRAHLGLQFDLLSAATSLLAQAGLAQSSQSSGPIRPPGNPYVGRWP
jgi:hypothetical protein